MKPETPSDIQVITELDVYEATIRKATHESAKEFSWDNVPVVEQKADPKPESKVETKEEKIVQEAAPEPKEDQEDLARKELIDKLMADIMKPRTLTPVEEDESFYDDMPALVPDTEDENGQQWSVPEDYDWMLALYKKPSCHRCEAALKALMSVSDEETKEESQENSEEESQEEESEESETSEEDSDSDYVPSESSDASSDEYVPPRRKIIRDRECNIPPLIKYTFTIIVVIYILKLLLIMNERSRYRPCYS
jgi:hypothetical protein